MANAFILPFLFYRVAEKGQGVGRWLETFIIPAGKFARLMGLVEREARSFLRTFYRT